MMKRCSRHTPTAIVSSGRVDVAGYLDFLLVDVDLSGLPEARRQGLALPAVRGRFSRRSGPSLSALLNFLPVRVEQVGEQAPAGAELGAPSASRA